MGCSYRPMKRLHVAAQPSCSLLFISSHTKLHVELCLLDNFTSRLSAYAVRCLNLVQRQQGIADEILFAWFHYPGVKQGKASVCKAADFH